MKNSVAMAMDMALLLRLRRGAVASQAAAAVESGHSNSFLPLTNKGVSETKKKDKK